MSEEDQIYEELFEIANELSTDNLEEVCDAYAELKYLGER